MHIASKAEKNWPEAWVKRCKLWLGDEWEAFEAAHHPPHPISVRLHPEKGGEKWADMPEVIWYPLGRYLTAPYSFIDDPGWHGGRYYVQEASSMGVAALLRAAGLDQMPLICLDAAAAPGGKTTLLADVLHRDALILSNEVDRKRSPILCDNVQKWATPRIAVSQQSISDFHRKNICFDLIWLDAPCSGEGMFRKDSFAIRQWSPALVSQCSRLQKTLIPDMLKCIAPGGYFGYSTCTYAPEENMAHYRWMQDLPEWEAVPIDSKTLPGWRPCGEGAFQALPHCIQGEGFFMMLWRKKGEWMPQRFIQAKLKTVEIPDIYHSFLIQQNATPMLFQDEIFAVPSHWVGQIEGWISKIQMIQAGIPLGQWKNKQWIPHHASAYHHSLTEAWPKVELSRDQALRFLRKELPPNLPEENPEHWYVVTFEGYGIGWLKKVPGRWNNHLPKALRILKR